MALSEEQEIKIGKILGQTPTLVDLQISLMGTMSAARQSAIEEELDKWDTVGEKYVDVDPNNANFGSKIRADRAKNAIRNALAMYLERPEWAGGSGVEFELVRG